MPGRSERTCHVWRSSGCPAGSWDSASLLPGPRPVPRLWLHSSTTSCLGALGHSPGLSRPPFTHHNTGVSLPPGTRGFDVSLRCLSTIEFLARCLLRGASQTLSISPAAPSFSQWTFLLKTSHARVLLQGHHSVDLHPPCPLPSLPACCLASTLVPGTSPVLGWLLF